jgi:hypothetical protein
MDYRNEDELLFDTGGMMEDDQWPGGEVDPDAVEDYERDLYDDGGEFHLGRSKDDEFGFYDDDDDGDFMDRPYYDDEAYTKDFLSVKDDPMDEDDDYIEGYDDDDYYIDEMCEECGDKKKGYTHSDMLYELEDGEEDFEGDDDLDFEGDREMSRKSDGMFKNPNNMMPENWVVERNGKRLRLTFNKKLMSESLFKTKIQRFEKMGYDVKAFPTKVLMEKYMRK